LGRREIKWQAAEENFILRSFVTCTPPKQNQKDQVREDEIGRACSMNGEKRNACRILVAKPEG
jgi:hypothetical protein